MTLIYIKTVNLNMLLCDEPPPPFSLIVEEMSYFWKYLLQQLIHMEKLCLKGDASFLTLFQRHFCF